MFLFNFDAKLYRKYCGWQKICSEHKQKKTFWLGRSHKQNLLKLLLLLFSCWTESFDHQPSSIEALNKGFKIDNHILLANSISFLNISLVHFFVYVFIWYFSGVRKFHIKWKKSLIKSSLRFQAIKHMLQFIR